MKKVTAIIVTLLFMAMYASASADFMNNDLSKYNSAAALFGAQKLDKKNAISALQDGNYVTMFYLDKMTYGFICDDSNTIRTVAIYAKDDAQAADFLCSCMAAIWFLGDYDNTIAGALLQQFMDVRKGEDAVFMFAGKDSFTIRTSDEYKYQFFYVNSDGAIR